MFRRFVMSAARILMRMFFRIEIAGADKLPENGGYIIAANHLSFWDPVFIGGFLSRQKIHFLAKDELFRFAPFAAVIRSLGAMPVNRGKRDFSVVKTSVEILKDGGVVCIFPEGTRIRKGKKSVPKKGTVRMAQLAGVPVIPIHLDADCRYKLFTRARLVVGNAVRFTDKTTELEISDASRELMNTIYSL